MDSYESQTTLMIKHIKNKLKINEKEEEIILAFETKQDQTNGKVVTSTTVKGGHNGEKYDEYEIEGLHGVND